jgi:hypothetical protein
MDVAGIVHSREKIQYSIHFLVKYTIPRRGCVVVYLCGSPLNRHHTQQFYTSTVESRVQSVVIGFWFGLVVIFRISLTLDYDIM